MEIQQLPGALYSVSRLAPDSVWAVGADVGQGPMVWRSENAGDWRSGPALGRGSLWWVTPASEVGMAWSVGDSGRVVYFELASGQFTELRTPGPERLYGAIAAAQAGLWVCGGDVAQRRGVVWRWDGTQWNNPFEGQPELLDGLVPFKIWREGVQLWIVGLGGHALYFDGATWRRVDVPDQTRLVTVHGNAGRVVAVGGNGQARIFEWQAGAFVERPGPGFAPPLNGVAIDSVGRAVAVGNQGTVWRELEGQWIVDADALALARVEDLHAVHLDDSGVVYAVGGFLLEDPATGGVLSAFEP